MFEIISHTSKPSESVIRLRAALHQDQPEALHYGQGVDKLTQYQYFKDKGLPHPPWSIKKEEALAWQQEGHTILARQTIKGQTGSGIVVVTPEDVLPDAKVYTQYVKKKREFRVNIFKDVVVNLREKLKQKQGTSSFIRNKANGYTTTHCKPMSPELETSLKALAMEAREISPSDFVGVDLIYNEFYNKLYILEVNGGPSIEGSSVQDFIKAMGK